MSETSTDNLIAPWVHEIAYQDPLEIYSLFAHYPWTCFLDSAYLQDEIGEYSYIAIDPFRIMLAKNNKVILGDMVCYGNPLSILESQLQQFPLKKHEHIAPFQGGAVGYLSYDLYQHLEKIPRHAIDDMQFPDLSLGFYDLIIAFDLKQKKAWICASGYPKKEHNEREEYAQIRINFLLNKLNAAKKSSLKPANRALKKENLTSNFSRETYLQAVQTVIDYIYAGDIFEANLSQRFKADLPHLFNPFELYCRLRKLNPAPFAAYVNTPQGIILSASPERFLKVSNSKVQARPIKGTRARGKEVIEDNRLSQELMTSSKDHAENIMIVDLLRNDLSRVCAAHSVQVTKLCGLESYATVHHLVSVIEGQLVAEKNYLHLIESTFPGGSISGAPKIRAMEIIAEIEQTQRGPYCGSVVWFGFNNDMDASIIIRSYLIKNNQITFQVGGAIVSDSDPYKEYDETLTKAWALQTALCEVGI